MQVVEEPRAFKGLEELTRYDIGSEPVGTGGFGKVYRAEDRTTGQTVAVKVYHNRKPDLLLECLEYTRLPAATFNHEGLVSPLETGVLRGRPYVVMEWAAGQSLATMIRDRSLEWPEIKVIFTRLFDTLLHLKRQGKEGVIHGDIKPENIVGTKLIDYDTMRAEPAYTEGRITGTPWYMAPEEQIGVKMHQTDVYHVCAVLYETLFGQVPFEQISRDTGIRDPEALLKLLFTKKDVRAPAFANLKARELWNAIFETGLHPMFSKRPNVEALKDAVIAAADAEIRANSPIVYTPSNIYTRSTIAYTRSTIAA